MEQGMRSKREKRLLKWAVLFMGKLLGAKMICSLRLTASVSCSRSSYRGHKIFFKSITDQKWQYINSNLHQCIEDK